MNTKDEQYWQRYITEIEKEHERVKSEDSDGLRSFLSEYAQLVFNLFERITDCGKETVMDERRCYHHVLSPLQPNPKNYLKFSDNPWNQWVSHWRIDDSKN